MTWIPSAAVDAPASVIDRLPEPLRDRLASLVSSRSYGPVEVILREGEDTPFLAIVESGRVALRLRVPELGDRLTIVTIEPGELLGWSAVVPPFRATVDAIATEPARLLAFDAAELRQRLATDDELAAALLPLVLESVAHRLSASWHQLLDMFATRAPEPW
jgi:CRP/FNR family transcriptional regulator, cyclic AMP receptor protein